MFITNWCIRERLSVWMVIKYNKVTNWRMQTNFQSLKLGLDTVWGPFVRSLDFRWVWKNLHSVDCHNHTPQKYYENAMNNTSTSQAPCSNNANSVKSSTRVCWLVGWLIDSSCFFTAARIQERGSERLQRFHFKHSEALSSESDDETARETWHRLSLFCYWLTCAAWLLVLLNFTSGTSLVSWFPVLWRAPPTAKPHWSKPC